ncbi:MAG: hypothetical protein OXG97_15230 [Candidatus Poribacteria bacterium]|nr:hypothetical protein [Candidatus Poribacteria bacterium]
MKNIWIFSIISLIALLCFQFEANSCAQQQAAVDAAQAKYDALRLQVDKLRIAEGVIKLKMGLGNDQNDPLSLELQKAM